MRIEQSFLPVEGIGEKTERSIWEAGITRWGEFHTDVSGVGPTLANRIERFTDEARSRLAARDAEFFADRLPGSELWRCYADFRSDAAFFDIETTGLEHHRDRVTTVSVHRGRETTTLVRGRDLTADALRAELGDASLLVSFNGTQFDAPFLETSFDLTLDRPHLDLRFACERIGLSGGLKAVEREVGIDRDLPELSGRDAVRLWREHERGDEAALDRLVRYNRDDAVNLRALADVAVRRLHAERVPKRGPSEPRVF